METATKFEYSEETYLALLIKVETETGLRLTEPEAGLCRALLDIISRGEAGACVGHHFKLEFKRFVKLGLIHAPTFKHTGVCVPSGKLEPIIKSFLNS